MSTHPHHLSPQAETYHRDNLDPKGNCTDADLNDALNLIHQKSNTSNSFREKFHLDADVLNEGSNFSAGERQLCKPSVYPPMNADGQHSGTHQSNGQEMQSAPAG